MPGGLCEKAGRGLAVRRDVKSDTGMQSAGGLHGILLRVRGFGVDPP